MARGAVSSNHVAREANIFRSEEMQYVHLYLPQDVAHDAVEELGHCGLIEFVDLNDGVTAFQRRFAGDIKRCEEIQRKLRYFRGLVQQEHIESEETHDEKAVSDLAIDDLETHVSDLETQLVEVSRHIEELTASFNRQHESKLVLQTCSDLSSTLTPSYVENEMSGDLPLLEHDMEAQRVDMGGKITTICGAVPISKATTLESVLFRITRGNCLVRFSDSPISLNDPRTGETTQKQVFMVFTSAKRVQDKVTRVIDALGGNRYAYNASTARDELGNITQSLGELEQVLKSTTISRKIQLQAVAQSLHLWEVRIAQEKSILHVMNLFKSDPNRAGIEGEGWVPKHRINLVKQALLAGSQKSRSNMQPLVTEAHTRRTPPTYFETNRLTSGFQAIVDAYGVADYREFNPTPFTVITFPFLFAVMFGDLGHGTLMLVFALWMLWNEKKFMKGTGEIFAICFGGRYVILLMAIFSVYMGLLYNETFSLAINFFDSVYHVETIPTATGFNHTVVKANRTYEFGFDPVWKQADNELQFTNNFKMKMSIVFGVLQMMFGISLSAFNYVYFKDWVSLINVFVPQILFMGSVFGYMLLLIFVKWSTDFTGKTHCAPSILSTFISMFLSMGAVDKAVTDDENCHNDELIPSQVAVQQVLLVVAVISVPWMLLAKPLIQRYQHKKQKTSGRSRVSEHDMSNLIEDEPMPAGHGHGHGHGEYDFGEEMVHNIIHTIEFVLGAVSNTASYLRLWALSLAHAQLSTVFWEKGVVDQLKAGGIFLVIGFFVWVMCTLGVLMVMESLSAFLHALRLHWVEFQNKFYKGTGIKFVPFRFGKGGAAIEHQE